MPKSQGVSDDPLTQLHLFRGKNMTQENAKNGGSAFSDPAFASNKTQRIHRWVPWIAGFSSSFVRDALIQTSHQEGIVLDPFAGVGTTLVEAALLGREAIGFEINPYAAMACRVKANASTIDPDGLHAATEKFHAFFLEKISSPYIPHAAYPSGFKTRAEFYSPKVLRKVLVALDFITTVSDPDLMELFQLAFASTMVSYSNYSYEPSLGRRTSAGKGEILDYPVELALIQKLREMRDDILWYRENLHHEPQPHIRVHNDTFFHYQTLVETHSVDLVITSPPYLNNYHYNRNTRPHLYWLGFVNRPQDFKSLEMANFGKYWQTVRDKARIELEFTLPDSDLDERLRTLREINPEKGIYGGSGWANYAAAYFNDCYRFVQGLKYVLRPGGTALVVIGNSIIQGIMIPTDRYLGQIAASLGLELAGIEVPRQSRVGNSIIRSNVRVRKAKASHSLYEAVVKIRQPH